MGLCLTVECVFETPILWFSGRVLLAIGEQRMLAVVMATYAVRLAAYAALPSLGNPVYILAIEPLHGVTFGLMWTAGVSYANKLAPEGFERSMQATYGAAMTGGGVVGLVAFGGLYSAAGGPATFATAAALMAVAAACYAALAPPAPSEPAAFPAAEVYAAVEDGVEMGEGV